MANAKLMTTMMVILVLAVVAGVVFLFMNFAGTSTTSTTTTSAPDNLIGKPSTLSIKAVDAANDDTQLASHGFVCLSPTVTADEITCNFLDDKTLSATSTTDFTSGTNVGGKYVAISSNNTYFGFPTEEREILTQGDPLTLSAYTTTSSITITMEDEDGNALGENGATRNLTLGASDVATLEQIKIKQTTANTALNMAGLYIDLVANSNITTVESVNEAAIAEVAPFLQRTEADQEMFLLPTPVLLKEQASLTIDNAISFTADSDGISAAATEDVTFYILDRIWVKSSTNSNKMIYAYETDSASQSDVGLTDPTFVLTVGA